MLINRLIAPLTAATVALLSQAALADLLIKVDKSAQHMTVTVNGEQLYDWPVSTGRRGYDTPSGNFKPFRMEIDHYSEEWDNAPMPYSIFFTKTGDAVHGTYEQRNLGHAMSHGCVRLSVKNAATLWKLVKGEKMANTTVVLSGAIPDAGPPAVARSKPLPLTTDDQRSHALPQDQRPYNDGPPQPGAKQLGKFYELESSSPALALKPGASATHRHETVHLQGAEKQLEAIARAALGVGLEDIKTAFKQ